MSAFRLIALLLLPTLVISSHAQLKSLDPAFEALNRHGVSASLDLYTDVFAGRDLDRDIQTAPFFLDLGATLALSHLSPVLAHTTAFTSLHVNQTVAGEFSSSIQSISSIQAESGVRVAEFWVEQALQPAIHLRAGKIDANRDFAFVENGANFLNAAAGYTPAFVTLPNYNESRLGAELLLRSRSFHVNIAGFSPIQGTGVLLIEEVGANWGPGGWNGRISGGYWGITGTMSTLGGWNRSGATGAYAVAEQKFWHERHAAKAGEQSLSAYLQLGRSADEFSSMPRHAALGVLWSAPLHFRNADAAGFSCSRGRSFRYAAVSYYSGIETAWEGFYRIHISNALSFTPDFQYITETSEMRATYAAGARISLNLHSDSE
jgi:carbohydrate-selective porin OprB